MSYSGGGSNFSNPYYQNQYYTGANANVNNVGSGNVNITQNVSGGNYSGYTHPWASLFQPVPYQANFPVISVNPYPQPQQQTLFSSFSAPFISARPAPTYPQYGGGVQNIIAIIMEMFRRIFGQQQPPPPPVEQPVEEDPPYYPINHNTVFGTAGNDSLRITKNRQIVYGLAGNDIIRVNSDNNNVNASSGNDKISMADDLNGNEINGDHGDDLITFNGDKTDYEITQNDDESFTITKDGQSTTVKNVELFRFGKIEYTKDELLNTVKGDEQDNTIDVKTDNQTVNAGAGDDTVNVNSKNNTINGEDGDDTVNLNENTSNNTVNAGTGDDTVNVKSDSNTIKGEAGDDTVNIGDGIDGNKIDGGEGENDSVTFTGNKADYEITENEGVVTVSKDGKSTTVENVEKFKFGNIEYTKDEVLNNIKGNEEDNTIDVKTDNQTVNAGTGDDTVNVNSKNNTINGEDGDDTVNLNANADNNTVNAGTGDDTVNVKSKNNTVNTEDGDDKVILETNADNNTVNGGAGNDTVDVNSSSNTINTADDNDVINIQGNLGNNTIDGGAGDDLVTVTGELNRETYSMSKNNDGSVTLTSKSNNQSIVMKNVERIKFGEREVTVDQAISELTPPPPPPPPRPRDPVILDTDGNNKIDLTSVEDGVSFDMDGDGTREQVAWTEDKDDKTDSWLVMDRSGNGQIDDGKELFGDQHGTSNGFEELKKLDDNQDGVIDSKDAAYGDLSLWQDSNHDGISQADELVSLEKAGVESVNLAYETSEETDQHGNELREQSSFTRTDEKASEIALENGTSVEDAKKGKVADAWVNSAS